ncbi:hypothetical protein H2200_006314 [Cladophialophora chaetospira]|uniref:Xylanolytic transcriptional activator regulatory domain-containing protein n=1 Tax=Cladophialophora chaetospira TaxID=386627 RepID=A0AA38XAP6_9EURO|nr:hypothetical protein H2200_006314 [Cladophialophora chaetospira]
MNAVKPDPPPLEVLQSLVKLYTDRIAGQPLPLFDTEALPNSIHRWSKGLFNSFLALTVRYSDHVFFGDASAAAAAAAERYKKSASEILFAQLADSTADLEVFQGFCLLCLSEIYGESYPLVLTRKKLMDMDADGNMRKAWIAVGVATRLAISSGIMGTKIDGVLVNSELSRCCWSLFILDRIHGSSFLTLPAIFNEDSFPEMPPSPARPDVSNQNAAIESGEPQITLEKDLGINSYALQLLSIWGRLMSYLKNIRQGNLEDAWAANSTYQQIKSEMSRVETILPEVHRFRNSRFHELTLSELESHRAYWASWIFTQLVYHCIHCTLNHPFLHIARIPGQRRLRSPSFLQHATDQAVLHSAWVVLILGVCEQSGFKIFDPFIGHLASMIATAQFFLQFSKDETLAARASKDFRMLQGFVEKMSGTHAHLEHVASKLSRLAQFATGSTETNSFLPPKIETALLWNLLDYAVSSSTVVDGGDPSDNVEVAVNTQFLLPINAETPMPVSAQPHQQEGPRPDFWDQTTFEFDMADFANVSDMSGWTVPNESWITGHL